MAASEIFGKLDALSTAASGESAECLSDEEVLAFASGTLESARHAEAHEHFDQCEVCQRLLSEAAHALATGGTTPLLEGDELSWHTTFQPGTLVGHRYLIRQFIARGGMGEVYEAFDRDLQERVALKTVTSTACDDASAVRTTEGRGPARAPRQPPQRLPDLRLRHARHARDRRADFLPDHGIRGRRDARATRAPDRRAARRPSALARASSCSAACARPTRRASCIAISRATTSCFALSRAARARR